MRFKEIETAEEIREAAGRQLRSSLLRGVAGVAFGFGLFFSLFVAIAMTATAGVHSFWILLIPIMMITYGCSKIDSVDKFLRIHFGTAP